MEEIYKYIGNWGKYQLFVYSLILIPAMLSCCIAMMTVFAAGVPNVRCKVPGFDQDDSHYAQPFDENVTAYLYPDPITVSGAKMYCSYCSDPNSTISQQKMCLEYEATRCHEYVYDKSQYHSTLISLFGLVCDNYYKRQILHAMFPIGIFFGVSAFGAIGDRFGRRTAFIIAGFLQIFILNAIPFVYNYYAYCALQICIGAAQAGTYLCSFIVVMELFGGLPKTIFGVWVQGLYAMGYVYIGVSAYFNRDWRHLVWSVSVLPLLYIPLYWLFPESIRWLVVNKEYEKAKKIVRKAAKWNNAEIPEAVLEKELKISEKVEKGTILDLFRSREFAVVTLIVFFTWMACTLSYYGLSWNTASLPGNQYVNFILSGLSELPSYIICIPVMEYFGRRHSLTAFFGIGGLCIICGGFITNSILIIVLTNLGKLCISAAFSVTYNYTSELFPTTVRSQASGFSSSVARIGSMSAPQIALLAKYVDNWLPALIYGSFTLAASILVCFLPETKGYEMTETVAEGIAFIKKQKHKVANSAGGKSQMAMQKCVENPQTLDNKLASVNSSYIPQITRVEVKDAATTCDESNNGPMKF